MSPDRAKISGKGGFKMMTKGRAIARLQALKREVLADGKIDWEETGRLLAVVRPLAKRHGFMFEDYVRLLEKCREDGRISAEESDVLALQLDYLCSFFSNLRLKFWLMTTVLLLAICCAVMVIDRVARSVEDGRPKQELPSGLVEAVNGTEAAK